MYVAAPKSTRRKPPAATAIAMADAASWCCALLLVALVLLTSLRGSSEAAGDGRVRGGAFAGRPCDEIYVVGEGETLHTISGKCGDPYIVEQNPHIHDPDDVFPGLVIKITPSKLARHRFAWHPNKRWVLFALRAKDGAQ